MAKKPKLSWHAGGCHCGAVRFEAAMPADVELIDCNCSMCHRTGYLHLVVSKDNFRITKGKTKLTKYVFNTGVAKHFFCSVCGIKSFYVPRSHPNGYSINFRCLDDPKAFHSVVTTEFDGKEWEKNAGDLAPLEAR
ncbi:MAG: GFA family protein [Alphaproteobacteria bacterium]|nr:GFA family protein [Alphaproteobacteria bacterium]MBL6939121.1 GFA family protein [Alphaproteobacteria bacterium]MBL7096638.1 GFA family protein [Alphaproteobacteria bacterium]